MKNVKNRNTATNDKGDSFFHTHFEQFIVVPFVIGKFLLLTGIPSEPDSPFTPSKPGIPGNPTGPMSPLGPCSPRKIGTICYNNVFFHNR